MATQRSSYDKSVYKVGDIVRLVEVWGSDQITHPGLENGKVGEIVSLTDYDCDVRIPGFNNSIYMQQRQVRLVIRPLARMGIWTLIKRRLLKMWKYRIELQ